MNCIFFVNKVHQVSLLHLECRCLITLLILCYLKLFQGCVDGTALIGNNVCNEIANNQECNYDGGDCCSDKDKLGNGFCNDDTNTQACFYDGGDCCGSCLVTDHCSVCQCLSGFSDNNIVNPLIGNGICNDEINIASCDYDGGDCLTVLNGIPYYFIHSNTSYDQAQSTCKQKFNNNGRLFEPTYSFGQANLVIDYAKDTYGWMYVWLGIHDRAVEGSYIYASSGLEVPSSISDLISFAACDPNTGEHAYLCDLLVAANGQIFLFVDTDQVLPINAICENSTSSKFQHIFVFFSFGKLYCFSNVVIRKSSESHQTIPRMFVRQS